MSGVCRNSVCLVVCLLLGGASQAEPFSINTIGGPVTVDVPHVGPGGAVVTAPTPPVSEFRPPSIFSAPLRSGSGGRALALGGAFTAVADDATAASWNPAGLVQLEESEASVVMRASRASNRHSSTDSDYRVGEDVYENMAINYMSLVQPAHFFDRNFVFSLNYKEDYDFTQQFRAKTKNSATSSSLSSTSESFSDTKTEHYNENSTTFPGGINSIDLNSHLTTLQQTTLRERIASGLVSDLDFEQEGVIDAVTLAGAAEVTPSFALGAALNVHGDNTLGGNPIQSRTTAKYKGTSTSDVWQNTTRTTSGTYDYDGFIHVPPGGSIPFPLDIPISGSGNYEPFTDSVDQHTSKKLRVDGKYEEINEFRNLTGYNGTFGAHWTTCRFLTLGLSLDLPWTATARQTKTLRNTVTTTTYDESGKPSGTTTTKTLQTESSDVELDFPLYWSAGGLMRWTDRFYSTLDISQTQWSQFSYKAEGQSAVNPLDGSEKGENELDDCWAVRKGAEYLLPTRAADIAFRGGLFWEQRPATGTPDDYFGFSLGTGLSLGKERRLIFDIAWMHTFGDDVMGSLVPGQRGLTTDVAYDEVYVSTIWRF